VREVRAGDVIEGRGWTVRVGHAAHVQPFLQCLAFRIDGHEGSMCYSGDSGPCDALTTLARGCDVLIHMNHFFSGAEPSAAYRAACGNHRDNAAMAREAGVKTLVLTHLTGELDRPGIRERVLDEIATEFTGRVIWGQDLLEILLDRSGVQTVDAPTNRRSARLV
jgi:ribonuclease BN (tRNA processing enzyme)